MKDDKNSSPSKLGHPRSSHEPVRFGSGIVFAPPNIELKSPVLEKNQRGLVISTPLKMTANSLLITPELDAQELRFSLLFWDHLDFPLSLALGIGASADVDFLMSADVMSRSRALGGSGGSELMLDAFVGTFRQLDERDPGRWSLARGEKSLTFPEQYLEEGKGGLSVKLLQAIPVPSKDVPLADLLEFRDKRRAELLALREHLDSIYQTIENSAEKSHASAAALDALDRTIGDLLKVSKESSWKFILSGLELKVDVLDFKLGSAVALGALQMGLPISTSILSGLGATVVPTISIKNGVSLKRSKPSSSPFEYVTYFHRDLF